MGEAAVKEPSMEDILSSIRKIISEEGNKPEAEKSAEAVMPDVTEVAVALEQPVTAPEVHVDSDYDAETAHDDQTSGGDAARLASSLAGTEQSTPEYSPVEEAASEVVSQTNIWEEVAQLNVEGVEPASETLADEPEAIQYTPETTEHTPHVPQAPVEEPMSMNEIAQSATMEQPSGASEPQMRVEMAQATPAPDTTTASLVAGGIAGSAISSASLETMVEEEMAFKGALMSPRANGEVAGAFDRLKRSAMDDVDAKTEAILRPMLREWLDENLPNMVERLVREEIERVARGV